MLQNATYLCCKMRHAYVAKCDIPMLQNDTLTYIYAIFLCFAD